MSCPHKKEHSGINVPQIWVVAPSAGGVVTWVFSCKWCFMDSHTHKNGKGGVALALPAEKIAHLKKEFSPSRGEPCTITSIPTIKTVSCAKCGSLWSFIKDPFVCPDCSCTEYSQGGETFVN